MPRGHSGRPPATCHPHLPTHARGLCSTCYRREHRQLRLPPRPRKPRPMALCHPDRLHRAEGKCNSCYQRDWKVDARRRIPGKRAAYNRKTQSARYRLTPDQLQAMIDAQGGRCAACGHPHHALQVDHCHKTGMVRGLLCGACNSAAGRLHDDPARLRKLADYLEAVAAAEPASFPLGSDEAG